ncbi:MAG: retroviral-like aspartic protease family protein [Gammaproteobacteria bacterium]|nr:retroviral-like aspartic protease family protein [Gammaproteobacteria bacterium]
MKTTIAKRLLFSLLLVGLFAPVYEIFAGNTPRITVTALFRDKAMVELNGESILLKAGGELKNGIRLIKSNSKHAIIEVNGKQRKYGLGSQASTKLSEPGRRIVRIPSTGGMFLTSGMINGRSVDFLVDTGASYVTMARPTADRLQIQYLENGKPATVSTAAQLRRAWQVKLNSVTVGGITLNQVNGTVIDTQHDQEVLLGMSFLNRLKFSQEQGLVVLEARFN